MKMSTIRFVIILAAVTTLSKADITSLEMKVEGLENLISSMQTFVLQDMILIKGKLANTDRKLEQLFDRIDNLQSTERVGGISEGDIEQISAKATQLIQDTFNYFGKNGEQLSSEMSSVAINISSQLDDRVGEVVIRLDNISLECVKSIGRLNNHNEKMMFLHRFDGIGIKHFHVLGARARLANATLYDTNGVQGRLEVNVNGEWGTVCNVNFDTSANPYGEADEETVSCRTLGAGFTKGLALPNIPFGQSMGP
ncbi:hypothetical protein MAR_003103, partial [Mya arenaria]